MPTVVKNLLKYLVLYGVVIQGLFSMLAVVLPGLHVSASVQAEVAAIGAFVGALITWAATQNLGTKTADKVAGILGFVRVPK